MKLSRLSGLPVAIVGVLLLSPDSLVIRLVSADRFMVLFWRGLMMAVGFAAVAGLSRGPRPEGPILRCDRPALIAGLLLGAANVAFVISITSTDVANTFVIAGDIAADRRLPEQALSARGGRKAHHRRIGSVHSGTRADLP